MGRKKFTFPVTTLLGTDVANYLAICRGHRTEPRFYPKWVLSFLISAIFEIFNLLERIVIRKKMKKQSIGKPPVFIIGFWRSGTTLLHNLLCTDPEAGYSTTFQAVFPNILLTQGWWMKPIINWIVPQGRPFDNVSMDMDFPQEEEFGMANLQAKSLYNFFIFPGNVFHYLEKEYYAEDLTEKERVVWKEKYVLLIKKALLNTKGQRYVSKNPCNLGRLELIRGMFPEGTFIFIYRNPYQVVESLYRFYLSVCPGVQLQRVHPDFSRETIVKFYAAVIRRYLRERSLIPSEKLLEIRMEDFMKDKHGFLEMIYKKLDLGSYDKVRPHVEKYLTDNQSYSRDRYETPQETYDLVNKYASDLVEYFGYRKENGPGVD
jgi:hypothetical protein